eukprot:185475-Hanusia_phi.AAC.1
MQASNKYRAPSPSPRLSRLLVCLLLLPLVRHLEDLERLPRCQSLLLVSSSSSPGASARRGRCSRSTPPIL